MADKSKRIFQIEINGVKETLDAVKSLNEALKDTDSIIKGLQDAKVDIKVSSGDIETEPKKTKVSSGRTTSNTDSAESAKDLAIQKQITAEKNTQAKLEALLTEEGARAYQNTVKLKQELKEQESILKSSALAYEELPTAIGDTEDEILNNIKLWDTWLKGVDRTEDGMDDLYKKVASLADQARKTVEIFQLERGIKLPGVFDAKIYEMLVAQLKNIPNTLSGIQALEKEMIKLRDFAVEGSEEFETLTKGIEMLINKRRDLTNKHLRAEDIIDTKLRIQLGDLSLVFDDVNQAVGILEDKLYQLNAAGKGDSDMAKELADHIIRLRTNVVQTDAAIDAMVGSSKGLKNVMSIVTGFTGIASIGQGLATLFGGQNEELDKSLQKFAGLSLVLQGIEQIQKEMNANTTAFGKTMNAVWPAAQRSVEFLGQTIVKVFNLVGGLGDKMFLAWNGLGKGIDAVDNTLVKFYRSLDFASDKLESLRIQKGIQDDFDKFLNKSKELKDLYDKLDDTEKKFAIQIEEGDDLSYFSEDFRNFAEKLDEVKQKSKNLSDEYENLTKRQYDLEDSLQGLNEKGKNTYKWADNLATRFPFIAKGAQASAKAINLVSKGIKALSSATVILLAIQLAFEAIQYAVQELTKIWGRAAEAMGISSKAQVDASKVLENQIQRTNEKLEKQIELQEELTRTGKQSVWQQQANEVKAYEQSIVDAGNELKKFIGTLDEANREPLTENLQSVTSWGMFSTDRIKDLDEFRKRYDILVKAVAAGTDKVAQGGKGFGWWQTASDAVDDLGKAQRAVIKDLNLQLSKIDYSNAEQATKQFRKLIDDEMYASALANIEDLFPEEQWAKNLKALVDQYKQFGGDLKKVNVEIAASMNSALRTIEQNNIAAIKQRFKRESEELENQYKWERKEAEGNAELVASIDNKYNTMRLNLKKQQAREIQDINYQIRENEIAAEKDGLDKRLKELQLAKEREIAQAVASDIKVGRQKEAIEKKYARLILDAKKEFTKNAVEIEKKTTEEILKAQAERNRAMMDLQLQYLRQEEDLQERIAELRRQTAGTELETQNISATGEISYDVNVSGEERLKQQMEYFNKLLEQQKKYNEAKKALDIETAKSETEQQKTSEVRRYEDSIQSLKDFKETQTETLKEHLKEKLITQEQYDKEIKEIEEVYNESVNKENKQHYELLEEITRNGEANINRIVSDYNEINKNNVAAALSSNISAYSDYYDEIGELAEKNTEKNHDKFGILNYKKEKKNLEDTKSEYKDLLKGIETQYEALQKALENKEISFNDFEKAKGELDDLKETVKDSIKTVNSDLSTLLGRVGESIVQMSMQYVNAFQDIWASMDNLFSISYDQQEMKLEKEQELLDEELEMLEEQYEKQEEITEKHKDKIDSIEDELSYARGDRREALLDQLAKERAAQLKSLETEEEIQKKKEQNERKQEALKKKQEQLEKKRWQQQKRNDIVNATISTFTGAANALKVQPIWAGIALAATVTALGLANVAKISSQKFYAKGGLLKGPSHAQGGIPVGLSGIEVEGNEYVINKHTTSKNLPLLEYVNSQKRTLTKDDLVSFYDNGETKLVNNTVQKKFAQGGQLPQMEQFDLRRMINYQQPEEPAVYQVQVVDIINSIDNLEKVKVLSGANV